jgi:hypothetical protein
LWCRKMFRSGKMAWVRSEMDWPYQGADFDL